MKMVRVAPTAKAVTAVIGGLGVGAVGGFAASLLRRRPQTTYTQSLSAPVADDDRANRVRSDELAASRAAR